MTSAADRRWIAWTAWAVATALVLLAVVGSLLAGLGPAGMVDSYVVTNGVMGLAFPLCGLILATRRPGNPIGWLFLADGLGHAVTASVVPVVVAGQHAGWPLGVLRTFGMIGNYAWPWSIVLFLPMALLLFPDGRPATPRWRWAVWAQIAAAPLFVFEIGSDPAPLTPGGPSGFLTLHDYTHFTTLWTIAELCQQFNTAVALVALVVRYRRGDERQRRQLLWLVLAAMVVFAVLIPWGLFGVGPILILLCIPLIGVAVTVAILRHQLLDIRLVISRSVLYLLLTAIVVAIYIVLVAVLDTVIRRQGGLGTSAVATVLIAVGFNPMRVRMQRLVDRALYGQRSNPVRAASDVTAQLADADDSLGGVVVAIRRALRLPYASLRDAAGEIGSAGEEPDVVQTIPLTYGGDRVGALVIGARPGERQLDAADRAVLELIAAPLSVALRATALSREVQLSRERIVSAREEERRRLRRDLHDGLGPVLTAATLQVDLARNLVPVDPTSAVDLLVDLRRQIGSAIEDIRRVAYGLRPPALDELGLLAALRQQIIDLSRDPAGRPVDVEVDLPDQLPELPAAVESAAYRIAIGAVSNALRHAHATRIEVRLRADGDLSIEVRDDGRGGTPWTDGVGLRSMHERAAELGGRCDARPTDEGGLVVAHLPLAIGDPAVPAADALAGVVG